MPRVYIPAKKQEIVVEAGTKLLEALTRGGVYPDAVCGGNGKCGKCRVFVDGAEVLACRTAVERDLSVALPETAALQVLQEGISGKLTSAPNREGFLLAFDIGTTSVVCFLLDGKTGAELAKSSALNPQSAFGADVISRIQAAVRGAGTELTNLIRETMTELIRQVCESAGVSPEDIRVVSAVGNPAMQQLFLGIGVENLSAIPFAPALTEAKTVTCGDLLPICPHAQLLVVPDISGYIGADTIGCILATRLHEAEEMTLLVDIGTNGEMVLGNKELMIACATAAGPALEGANIRCGMRAMDGAIDHVWLESGAVKCSVIGGGAARGICGSGLIDAVAVGLKLGLINRRGRIGNDDHTFHLTKDVYLTQEDIRQVQLAKGAIYAGICLMAEQLGLEIGDIQKVQLAGAFGSYLNPDNACRIGLLPEELLAKIEAVGNAAGSGAKILACDQDLLGFTEKLIEHVKVLELASLRAFPKIFARAMGFREECV